jgi:imidazolonepropionase-like amidohydrolase
MHTVFPAPLMLLVLFAGLMSGPARADTIFLTAAWLIDPLDGKRIADPVIEIDGDRIVAVTDNGSVPAGAKRIDLGEKTILPGLADLHTHLTWYASDAGYNSLSVSDTDEAIRGVVNARKTLMAGFTAARNLGASGFSDVSLRNAIDDGRIPGPRLQVSGPALGITGGHCDNNLLPREYHAIADGVADGPWGVRHKVRDNKKYGADVIKFCATGGVMSKGTAVGARQYTLEEMQAIVDEAHTQGMTVAAHAHGTEGILFAIRAGVDSVEHSSLISDEGLDLALKNGTFLSINLYTTEYILAEGEKNGVLPESMEKAAFVHERRRASFARAVKAGAKIVYSTDSAVYPHGDNAVQFSRMVDLGMSPMQAIRSATTVAAELLRWEGQTGAVAPGYYADIIAVDGNPIDDISVLENVSFVMKGGVVYKHERP